jgi:hypothetical protein
MSTRQRADGGIEPDTLQFITMFALINGLEDGDLSRIIDVCKSERNRRTTALRVKELGFRTKIQQYFMAVGRGEFAADITRITDLSVLLNMESTEPSKMVIEFLLNEKHGMRVEVIAAGDGYKVIWTNSRRALYHYNPDYLQWIFADETLWISLLMGHTDCLSPGDCLY